MTSDPQGAQRGLEMKDLRDLKTPPEQQGRVASGSGLKVQDFALRGQGSGGRLCTVWVVGGGGGRRAEKRNAGWREGLGNGGREGGRERERAHLTDRIY